MGHIKYPLGYLLYPQKAHGTYKISLGIPLLSQKHPMGYLLYPQKAHGTPQISHGIFILPQKQPLGYKNIPWDIYFVPETYKQIYHRTNSSTQGHTQALTSPSYTV
jgi:hypothetical protein